MRKKKLTIQSLVEKTKIDSSTVAKEKHELLSSNCRADNDAWAQPRISPV